MFDDILVGVCNAFFIKVCKSRNDIVVGILNGFEVFNAGNFDLLFKR